MPFTINSLAKDKSLNFTGIAPVLHSPGSLSV